MVRPIPDALDECGGAICANHRQVVEREGYAVRRVLGVHSIRGILDLDVAQDGDRVGERVELISEVTYVGRTSMEARIDVYAESMVHPNPRKVGSGYGVYVALDASGTPCPVPPLLSETEADHLRDHAARLRQAARLARRETERNR